MSDGAQEASKRRKGRSPSYPGLALEDALERARILYEHETRHPTPVETILSHWGYTPKSGTGLVAIAALKKFGLLTDDGSGGSRTARLTERALDILHDTRPDSQERARAIKAAALEPAIHRELFERYEGKLPSDSNLRFHLLRERGFTESGADEFIGELKATFQYARLSEVDSMSPNDGDKMPRGDEGRLGEDGMNEASAAPIKSESDVKDFQFSITLYGGRLATVRAPIPMSKRNLERLKRMISDQLEPFVDEDDAAEGV